MDIEDTGKGRGKILVIFRFNGKEIAKKDMVQVPTTGEVVSLTVVKERRAINTRYRVVSREWALLPDFISDMMGNGDAVYVDVEEVG